MDWPGAIALVAEDAGEIVGYVLGRLIVDEAEILSIATIVERRREGIGRRLLVAIIASMIERGAHAVWLEVRMSNVRLARCINRRDLHLLACGATTIVSPPRMPSSFGTTSRPLRPRVPPCVEPMAAGGCFDVMFAPSAT